MEDALPYGEQKISGYYKSGQSNNDIARELKSFSTHIQAAKMSLIVENRRPRVLLRRGSCS